jgi:hypothetical protein
MGPALHHHLDSSAFGADALFVSALQCSDAPSAGQVRQAIDAAVAAFGCLGCAERVAQEFGDHPEMAAAAQLVTCASVVVSRHPCTSQPEIYGSILARGRPLWTIVPRTLP